MSQSSINGQAAPLNDAIAEAVKLIGASRLTVVAGLGADVAGAKAAIALCGHIRGVVDHMHSQALLRDLDVMREFGIMLTTPGEARIRGDVVLLVGDGLAQAGLGEVWPDLTPRKLAPPAAEGAARRIFRLGSDETATIEASEAELPVLLAALRARVNGRLATLGADRLRKVDAIAEALRSATFGVAVWSAARLDALSIEMLSGLLRDLNAKTRFAGLPLAPADNAAGVQQVCGWLTGLPPRTSFGRGAPEHDPWAFDAERLIESGEADCVLWISAYGAQAPRWKTPVPVIALADAKAEFARAPAVRIEVGRPGVDHEGVDYWPPMGAFAARPASNPSDAPSVANVLGQFISALRADGAASC